MNPAVAEWVSKAEGDFITAGREGCARIRPAKTWSEMIWLIH
jgi:hypothetical protein